MGKLISQMFCRHKWTTKRAALQLEGTGEIVGVIVRDTCAKCGREKVRIAV